MPCVAVGSSCQEHFYGIVLLADESEKAWQLPRQDSDESLLQTGEAACLCYHVGRGKSQPSLKPFEGSRTVAMAQLLGVRSRQGD